MRGYTRPQIVIIVAAISAAGFSRAAIVVVQDELTAQSGAESLDSEGRW